MSDKLKQQFDAISKKLEDLRALYLANDGVIDNAEKAQLKKIEDKKNAIQAQLEQQGVLIFDPVTVAITLKDFNNQTFKTAFTSSIERWGNTAKIALNAAQGYFNSGAEDTSSFSIGDVLGVVKLALTSHPAAALAVEVIAVSVDLVQKAARATFPPQPSISELHFKWSDTITAYVSGDHDKEFEKFVELYKKENNIPADVYETPEEGFLKACTEFNKRLAKPSHIQKAFLTELLSKVKDSWDFGSDAGFAEIDMMGLVNVFIMKGGQIDDVGAQLMNAIKTVWSGGKAIDLPIPIVVTLKNTMGGNTTVIRRNSKTSGATDFVFESGDRQFYEDFMKNKAYLIPKVSELKYDD